MSSQRLFISHLTRYRYGGSVALARHTLHLRPRSLPWQSVEHHWLHLLPPDARVLDSQDAFANPITTVEILHPHTELSVRAESWVRLQPRPCPPPAHSPAWESVRERLNFQAGHPPEAAELEAAQFLFESRHVRVKRELALWALPAFCPGRPILEAVAELSAHVHRDFKFDPSATHVSTPVLEVLEHRRGVCQDFAHLVLSALRSLGLPARYVSGYLLTTPPPGKPRLLGADASHAWIAVWVPGTGWAEFDPTNGIAADCGHITLGWGRDFADVTPLRGVLNGGGSHEPEIEVTVIPEAEYATLSAAGAAAESSVEALADE